MIAACAFFALFFGAVVFIAVGTELLEQRDDAEESLRRLTNENKVLRARLAELEADMERLEADNMRMAADLVDAHGRLADVSFAPVLRLPASREVSDFDWPEISRGVWLEGGGA